MAINRESLTTIAAADLVQKRTARYRADEQAIELRRLDVTDRELTIALYAMLRDLRDLVAECAPLDASPDRLIEFAARIDLRGLLRRMRRFGSENVDDAVGKALHDIRGGALTALFAQLSYVDAARWNREAWRAISICVRDQMKIMRNVLADIDVTARARDLEMRPHSIEDLVSAMQSFAATVASERAHVEVSCDADGTIAESCVELGAVDRVAYNLLNNAARYADQPKLAVWIAVLESDVRVAVVNSISPQQRLALSEAMASDGARLYGTFTTEGTGAGLRIVSDLVGRAYGVATAAELTRAGYLGARVVDAEFVSWFHWPLAR